MLPTIFMFAFIFVRLPLLKSFVLPVWKSVVYLRLYWWMSHNLVSSNHRCSNTCYWNACTFLFSSVVFCILNQQWEYDAALTINDIVIMRVYCSCTQHVLQSDRRQCMFIYFFITFIFRILCWRTVVMVFAFLLALCRIFWGVLYSREWKIGIRWSFSKSGVSIYSNATVWCWMLQRLIYLLGNTLYPSHIGCALHK